MGLRDLFSRKGPDPEKQPGAGEPSGRAVSYAVREVLFGDLPMDAWPKPGSAAGEFLWSLFDQARRHLAAGDRDAAIRSWLQVTEAPGQESLHAAQAWHFLRAHGHESPAEQAKQVLGTVVEYGLEGGLDLVAAYPDRNARYYNHAGRNVVWLEGGDGSLDAQIDQLLAVSAQVASRIGPWEGARPPTPEQGTVRISFVTPSGLHFGEGPMELLSRDPMGGLVIHFAVELMQALMAKSENQDG